MQKTILSVLLLIFVSLKAYPAWLNFVEQTITQPDGTEMLVYASGDEFYHWLHDKNGYTIIKNPKTGYFTYAIEDHGIIKASEHKAGSINPTLLGVKPWLKISADEYKTRIETFSKGLKEFRQFRTMFKSAQTGTIHEGELNNIVVFITFKNGQDFVQTQAHYNGMLNTNDVSLLSYYKEVSYNKLSFKSHFFPVNDDPSTTLSYKDNKERSYYQPYDKTTNPNGYDGDNELHERLQALLRNALISVRDQIPAELEIDKDEDGYIDNLSFVVQGRPDGWSDLIWPHMSGFYPQSVLVNGVRSGVYTFQMESTNTQTFCHEMFHMLGAPDLYHYNDDYGHLQPVGSWDIMESGFGHMGAWMKYRYAEKHWITDIPTLTKSGTYTLFPLESEKKNCYRINTREYLNTNEFFILEYRKKETSGFERNVKNSGLLLYRINPAYEGNADGPPDEIYIYRPNGTLTSDGNINYAAMQNIDGYAVSENNGISAFLTDGKQSGLKIKNITAAGDSISFTLEMDFSSEAEILSFYVQEQYEAPVIDAATSSVYLKVKREADVTRLRPVINISDFAKVYPGSDTFVDLSEDFVYTITAEDGTQKQWTVYTQVMPSTEAEIKSFAFVGIDAKSFIYNSGKRITMQLPYGSGLTKLSPYASVSLGASINLDSTLTYDFSTPVTFTVTSEDGLNHADWTIEVSTDPVRSSYNLEDLVKIRSAMGYIFIESFQADLIYSVYTLNGSEIETGNLNGNVHIKIPAHQRVCIVSVHNKLGQVIKKLRVNMQ